MTSDRVAGSLREPGRVALGESDPPSKRRAPVALLVGLVAFIAIQFATHTAVQSEHTPLGDPIYADKLGTLKGHPEFFADTADRERVIALGSSRTQLCLDAERLTTDRRTVVNFAAAGCGPVTTALYVRRLLTAGLRCETALVELHPAMLADHNPPFEAPWLHAYRLRPGEVEVLRGYGWAIDTPPQFRPAGPLATSHTYRFSILNATHPKLLPCPYGIGFAGRTDARGHVPGVDVPPAERPKYVAAEHATYAAAFVNYRPGGPAVAAVRDTLAQFQAHGIRPILLLSPEGSEFRSWYGDGGDNAVSVMARELAAEFGVPLVNAREWLPDDQFADAHHATPAGARALTDHLEAELAEGGR